MAEKKFSFLNNITDEDRILLSHMLDMANAAKQKYVTKFTFFLDDRQQELCRQVLMSEKLDNYLFWGGFDQAERKMLGLFHSSDESNTEDISHRYQMLMSAILMSRICKSFADGKSALTADDLREQTSIPIRVVNDLLYKLCEAHLVLEVSTDEKGEASTFVPAESLDNLNVGVMMDRLEAQGHWNLKLPINRLLTKKWGSVVSMRSDFFNRASSVRLEDIVL